MSKIAILIISVCLAGCAEKQINELSYAELKQVAARIDAACDAASAKAGTPERQMCVNQEISRENAERQASLVREARFRRGMSAMGDGLQQASSNYAKATAVPPRTRLDCTSTTDFTGTTRTNCQ